MIELLLAYLIGSYIINIIKFRYFNTFEINPDLSCDGEYAAILFLFSPITVVVLIVKMVVSGLGTLICMFLIDRK